MAGAHYILPDMVGIMDNPIIQTLRGMVKIGASLFLIWLMLQAAYESMSMLSQAVDSYGVDFAYNDHLLWAAISFGAASIIISIMFVRSLYRD